MKISQREAQRLRRDNKFKQSQIDDLSWRLKKMRMYSGTQGTPIVTITDASSAVLWSLSTAHKLGHAVLASQDGNNVVFRALALPSEPL